MKRMTSQMAKLRKFPFINPVPEKAALGGAVSVPNVSPALGRYKGQTCGGLVLPSSHIVITGLIRCGHGFGFLGFGLFPIQPQMAQSG